MMHNKPSQVSVTPLCRPSQDNDPASPSELGSASTKKSEATSLLKPHVDSSTVSPIFSPMTSDLSASSVHKNKLSQQRIVHHSDSFNSPHFMLEPGETTSAGRETSAAREKNQPVSASAIGEQPRAKAGSRLDSRRSPTNLSRRNDTMPSDTASEFYAFQPPFGDSHEERKVIDKPRLSFTRKSMIKKGEESSQFSNTMPFATRSRKDGSFSSNDTSRANLSSHVNEDQNQNPVEEGNSEVSLHIPIDADEGEFNEADNLEEEEEVRHNEIDRNRKHLGKPLIMSGALDPITEDLQEEHASPGRKLQASSLQGGSFKLGGSFTSSFMLRPITLQPPPEKRGPKIDREDIDSNSNCNSSDQGSSQNQMGSINLMNFDSSNAADSSLSNFRRPTGFQEGVSQTKIQARMPDDNGSPLATSTEAFTPSVLKASQFSTSNVQQNKRVVILDQAHHNDLYRRKNRLLEQTRKSHSSRNIVVSEIGSPGENGVHDSRMLTEQLLEDEEDGKTNSSLDEVNPHPVVQTQNDIKEVQSPEFFNATAREYQIDISPVYQMDSMVLKRSSTADEPGPKTPEEESIRGHFSPDQSPDFRKEISFTRPGMLNTSLQAIVPQNKWRNGRHDSQPLICVGRLKRHDSPVEQSPLLMPDYNHKKKPLGNESVRSNSSSKESGVFCKPKLGGLGGATPSRGFASRMANLRPKLGFGGNSQADMISTQSFQLQNKFEKSKLNNFDTKYNFDCSKKLGEGMHTMVYQCTLKSKYDDKDSIDLKESSNYSDPDQARVASQLQELSARKEIFAVKIVRDNDNEKLAAHEREYDILKQLSHPNIVGAIEFFKDEFKNEIHQVLEYVPGNDLSIYLQEKGAMSEEMAAPIFRQVLQGISYLHQKNVCNRDIKPANIMLQDNKRAVIIDFNVSRMLGQDKKKPGNSGNYEELKIENEPSDSPLLKKVSDFQNVGKDGQHVMCSNQAGTLGYCAPERLEKNCKYTDKVDLWGAGIVLMEMLTNFHPFDIENANECVRQIKMGESVVSELLETDARMAKLSAPVKDLISKLLKNDPDQRLSAAEALKTEWIQASITSDSLKHQLIRKISAPESPDSECASATKMGTLANRARGMSKSVHDEPQDDTNGGFECISEQAPDQIIFRTQVEAMSSDIENRTPTDQRGDGLTD